MYLEDVRSISEQMCRTLAWLHGKGVLHLDLKPQNFVLESGGYCVTSPPLQASGRVGLWSMEEFRLCCPQPAQDGSACVEAGLASKAYSRPLDVRVRLIDFGMAACPQFTRNAGDTGLGCDLSGTVARPSRTQWGRGRTAAQRIFSRFLCPQSRTSSAVGGLPRASFCN